VNRRNAIRSAPVCKRKRGGKAAPAVNSRVRRLSRLTRGKALRLSASLEFPVVWESAVVENLRERKRDANHHD
jgi:hypothetical protein